MSEYNAVSPVRCQAITSNNVVILNHQFLIVNEIRIKMKNLHTVKCIENVVRNMSAILFRLSQGYTDLCYVTNVYYRLGIFVYQS